MKSIVVVENVAVPLVDEPEVQLTNVLIIEIFLAAFVLLTKLVIVCCLASVFRLPELRTKAPE